MLSGVCHFYEDVSSLYRFRQEGRGFTEVFASKYQREVKWVPVLTRPNSSQTLVPELTSAAGSYEVIAPIDKEQTTTGEIRSDMDDHKRRTVGTHSGDMDWPIIEYTFTNVYDVMPIKANGRPGTLCLSIFSSGSPDYVR